MNNRNFEYNWRATMGNASAMPADCADYLDLISSLVQEDGYYPHRTANVHTCAIDDPLVMLHHARREGLCTSTADHRLYDRTLAAVRTHRQDFFNDAEIARRMKQADGACPMCGLEPVFYEGKYPDGFQPQMSHCQHNLGHQVKAADIAAYLRRPNSWQGSTWPYAWMAGNKLTGTDGKPLTQTGCGRTPCQGCLEMEAYERMEQAMFKLLASVNEADFRRPGWSAPLSSYVCPWESCAGHGVHGKEPCDHVYMQIKSTMRKAHTGFGDSSELRLNGAGLKLYMRPVRSAAFGGKVSFSMRVGGDQVADYPGFQEFAHRLFSELGVPSQAA